MNSTGGVSQRSAVDVALPDRSDALWDDDRLGRLPDADRLLRALRQSSEPTVLLLEGPWGSGKTQFLKNLEPYLSAHKVALRYLNAWETMRYANPPMSILEATFNPSAADPDDETAPLTRIPAALLKKALLGGALVTGIVVNGTMPALRLVQAAFEAVPALRDMSKSAKEPSSEEQLKKQVEAYSDEIRHLKDYREMFGEELRKAGMERTVICIDELDRCRPEYALTILEIIHHYFLVEEAAFILTVSYDELSNSLTAVYGPKFDAHRYLRRFVDQQLYLRRGRFREYVEDKIQSLGADPSQDLDQYSAYLIRNFVIQSPLVSARDVDQRINSIRPSLDAGRSRKESGAESSSQADGILLQVVLITMGVMRLVAPESYRQFYRNQISDCEALEALNSIANRTGTWWQDAGREDEYKLNAVLEAVLIGWGRFVGGSYSYDTPLLRKRREEAKDGGYPRLVVAEAEHSAYQDPADFREAVNRLQGGLEASTSERVPSPASKAPRAGRAAGRTGRTRRQS